MWLRTTLSQYSVAVAVQLAVAGSLSSCDTKSQSEERTEPVVVAQSCDSCGYSLVPAPYTSLGGIPVGEPMIYSAVVIQWGAGRTSEDSIAQRNSMKHFLKRFPEVSLLDSVAATNFIVFSKTEQFNFVVSVKHLERNGWLLFTPGKDPVYCTAATALVSCNDSTLVSCYFRN